MRARAGKDVLLVDADKQASANLWAGIRREAKVEPPVACVQKTGKTLGIEVRELAKRYSDIIIDAGGHDSVELRAALTVVRLAVFPLQASLFDAATLETLSRLTERRRASIPTSSPVCFSIARHPTRTCASPTKRASSSRLIRICI
jgi:chromosome partitioning protein